MTIPTAPTMPLLEAAALLGISRSAAYASANAGTFPVNLIRVGGRILVPTAPLLALLGIDVDDPKAVA